MRRLVWLAGWLPVVCMLALPARGQEWAPPAAVSLSLDRWWLVDPTARLGVRLDGVDELFAEPATPSTDLDVRHHSVVREPEPPAVPSVPPEWRLLSLESRALWLRPGQRVTAEADVLGYAPAHPGDTPLPDTAPRLVRIGLTGGWGPLEMGTRFESVSRGLETVAPGAQADQESTRAWATTTLGAAGRLRVSVADVTTNVGKDPQRPEVSTREAATAFELRFAEGMMASVGLTHRIATRTPPLRADDRRRIETDQDSAVATLYVAEDPTWSMTVTTTYALTDAPGPIGAASGTLSHDWSATYRPTAAVSVVPTLSVSHTDPERGVGSRYLWASLTASVAPFVGPLDLTLYGSWTRSRTTDDRYDVRTIYATASLGWHLRRTPPRTTLSFEVGYGSDVDAAAGVPRYEEYRGLVMLRVLAF
jgi:hypothetical protein